MFSGHWWTLLRQAENVHGTGPASKIYMVGSRGRTVRVKWGAVEVQNRSIVPIYLQAKSRVFATNVAVHLHVLNLIERKLASGYEKAAPLSARL
jgi:hypothetical protein